MTIAMENQLVSRAHKGTGIASFVIGMVSIIAITALVGIAGVLTQSGKISPSINMMLGFGVIAVAMVDFFGIGLGVAGAADRSSRKVFPVLGLVLNVGIIVIFGALVAIGLSMKH